MRFPVLLLVLILALPACAETAAGIEQWAWFALFGPGGLPPALAMRMRDDVVAVLAEPEVKARIAALACEPGGEPPDKFAARVKAELAIWQAIAKEAGIVPE